jgi:hypothetical protein
MKLCKNCKHCKPYNTGNKSYGTNNTCYHPSVSVTDLVDGSVRGISTYRMRHHKNQCKPEGVLFEPKPIFFQKIKNLFVKEKT